jgi:hypothetical protein
MIRIDSPLATKDTLSSRVPYHELPSFCVRMIGVVEDSGERVSKHGRRFLKLDAVLRGRVGSTVHYAITAPPRCTRAEIRRGRERARLGQGVLAFQNSLHRLLERRQLSE